ncbi:MerR family transcriptional regulator [Companilactobacillus sp.]|jgi:DNA-binding transcriptional MerR regulator|uniref:MerR family transcriptional regulator n=1 Tax=Companilactobacillus sp. TaxID=2767905 RepID=UPI0025B8B674|nr:MerR family transcriptional regulator [Companilactobacillus sp.]MCH4008188.1 MerR family transcriptional regulator [Companilactobacillus sp.]MCH4051633.1 MerR family transcriptional regulator [Companilactobacillus sp.]MCH4076131.1 MerR family transcriptional regulator [Companilactobacillus sp.]MCH4124706.1 MerR family transcriptional regulator [Companilactobacillus sp.]MCH4131248.1 MerR family transcriptional regulator [Companilactobacillus sp.]
MVYSIGQVSKELGVTIDTIRYYDKSGLLPFVKRNEIGRREFTDNDIHLMRTIICLKNAGVSVSDISKFIEFRLQGDSTLDKRYQLLEEHRKDLQQHITDLQDTMSYLKYKEWYYKTAVDAGTETIHFVPGTNEVIPELNKEYSQHLQDIGDMMEYQNFANVKDYRNRNN